MVSDPQRAKVVAQLEAASAAGAEILVGGDRGGTERGHFLAPAVVTGADPDSDLLRKETFGPVAPIVPVPSLDEAIALANGTEFGLGANVYTGDLESAMRCMRELRAGTVWINDPLTDNDAGPFGGFKQSGLGRELGREGLEAFQETKHVHMESRIERKEWWYPYRERSRIGSILASQPVWSPTVADETETKTPARDVEKEMVLEREHWVEGPPQALFKEMRAQCPVHWTPEVTEVPAAAGFWSVTTADDVHAVSRDWETYSSELGGVVVIDEVFPIELARAMFIGMDPPKHDRLKALFQAGFTPKRIAAHEDEIRKIVVGVLDRLEGRDSCDLVTDVAQPAVSRVIGAFMGIPEEDDAAWAELMNSALAASDPDYSPEGVDDIEATIQQALAQIFDRCGTMIAERRENPTEDLTSVLVHAEVEGQKLEEHEIVMGFFLLVAAGNDSTKATYSSGMRALLEDPEQLALVRDDPALVPGTVEESLRMFPAFAHFRRTATRDTVLNGKEIKQGEKVVMWYASSNRDESRYEDPDRFDVLRNPEHQAFGAGGRHFCLGTALARLELKILFEETLARYPDISLAGKPTYVESAFLNQLKTLPVKLSA